MSKNAFIPSFALILLAASVFAGGYVELPREFGALSIGMSEKKFTRITGVSPESCAICIKKESFASLSREELAELEVDGDGADIFFYDKKLYLISLGTISKDLFAIKEEFEQEFGGPGKKIPAMNDVAKLKWEDQHSIVTINYHEKENRVFSVNYFDWDLQQERDWREAQAREEALKRAKTLVTIP